MEQFWKNYDIRDALENIKDAWDQLTASNIRAVWQRILPHCGNNFPGFDTVTKLDSTINEIKDFGINLSFTDLNREDVEELLNSHDKELEIDDLVNLEQERAFNIEELEDDENEEKTMELTMKEPEELLRIGEVLKEKIVNFGIIRVIYVC